MTVHEIYNLVQNIMISNHNELLSQIYMIKTLLVHDFTITIWTSTNLHEHYDYHLHLNVFYELYEQLKIFVKSSLEYHL